METAITKADQKERNPVRCKKMTIVACDYYNHHRFLEEFKAGQFVEAVWKSSCGTSVVSVKVDDELSENEKLILFQEAATLVQFQHQNIVKLHGIVADKDPVGKTSSYSTIIII